MGKKSTKDLVVIGAVGLGAYWLWKNQGQLFGGVGNAVGGLGQGIGTAGRGLGSAISETAGTVPNIIKDATSPVTGMANLIRGVVDTTNERFEIMDRRLKRQQESEELNNLELINSMERLRQGTTDAKADTSRNTEMEIFKSDLQTNSLGVARTVGSSVELVSRFTPIRLPNYFSKALTPDSEEGFIPDSFESAVNKFKSIFGFG